MAGATPFLNMFGWILGGWIMCKSSLAVKNNTNKEISDKFVMKRLVLPYFLYHLFIIASSLMSTIVNSHKSLKIIC